MMRNFSFTFSKYVTRLQGSIHMAMPWHGSMRYQDTYVQGKDYLTSKQIIEYYWNIAKVCLTACLMSVAAP